MRVTVTEYLNVRVGKPSVNAPTNRYLAPGSIIEIDGQLYTGDLYDNIDTWVKDSAGNYYWSGGVNSEILSSAYSWWITNYDIDTLWKFTRGAGIKVAILDSGIGINSNLIMKNIDGYNFVNKSNNYFDSTVGHGTHLAGIISGNGPNVFGVAPESTLFVCKITDEAGDISYPALMHALDKCIDLRVDIVNLSLAITPADFTSNANVLGKLQEAIVRLVDNNVFAVASCGNLGIRSNCYPACIKECISVSALDSNKELYKDSCESNTIDLVAPGVEMYSTLSNNQFCNLTGTSQAAAFTTGVLALMKSYMIEEDRWDFRKLFALFHDPHSLSATAYPSDRVGNGMINPLKLFDQINK